VKTKCFCANFYLWWNVCLIFFGIPKFPIFWITDISQVLGIFNSGFPNHQPIRLLFLQLAVAAVALNPLCIVSEACINYIFCGSGEISNEARNWLREITKTCGPHDGSAKLTVDWEIFGNGILSQPAAATCWAAQCVFAFPATQQLAQFPGDGGQWFGPLFTHCRRTCRNARHVSQLPKYLHSCTWYISGIYDCNWTAAVWHIWVSL